MMDNQSIPAPSPGTSSPHATNSHSTKPVAVMIIGMAGSGKTTLIQRIAHYTQEKSLRNYIVNVDPAVKHTPYHANVDIRDTVDYKQVMTEYGLGPNGAIMTSLNLFATRFDQVIDLMEKRGPEVDYALVDTPGQIEAFTWSASGAIITESLAVSFPSVLVYVVDTARTTHPTTFMSNMLYACSIMYKMQLPFILVFNKIDVVRHEFASAWMEDFEVFQKSIDDLPEESYMGSFSRSMSLVLEEFYRNIAHVGVSAATGEGMDDLFTAIDRAVLEYDEEYAPELRARVAKQEQNQVRGQEKDLAQVLKDMAIAEPPNTNREGQGPTTEL